MMICPRQISQRNARRRRRCAGGGFTFVELMTALVIFAMLATAACILLFGALNTNRHVQSLTTAESEIELAMRRMVNNIHEAQTGSIAVGTSTLTLLTQDDPAHGYSNGASVIYSLQADSSNAGQQDLMENDQRYGTNTLVHNVTTFNIALVSGSTALYQVDLVVGTKVKEERHFQVAARN
jgi:prepilin-type N-terminal cleavage/methylation domain-containing protein